MRGGVSPVTAAVGLIAALVLVFILAPSSTLAQEATNDGSRWGVHVTFVPKMTVPTGDSALAALTDLALEGAADGGASVEGNDFRIGVSRGRLLGGDWGVSWVRRSYKDGSTQGAIAEQCDTFGGQTQCFISGTEYRYQSVTLSGVEINRFISFVTIRRVVQIGLDLGGGVASASGTALKRSVENDVVNGRNVQSIVESEVPASTLFEFDPELIGRIEFALGVTTPLGVKARFAAGYNFPGTHTFSITAIYLIGARR